MKYYLVEGYDKWGDWSFIVFTDTEEQAKKLVPEHFDPPNETFKVHACYGPFDVEPNLVVMTRQPE